MTNAEKLEEVFPNIPEYSGIDYWGDFWQKEYKEQGTDEEKNDQCRGEAWKNK